MNITPVIGETTVEKLAALSYRRHAKSCTSAAAIGLRPTSEPDFLLKQIVDLEKGHKNYLAALAADWIYSAFDTSAKEIILHGSIVDKINLSANSTPFRTTILSPSAEIELEVSKCKIINFLVAGAGLACQELFVLKTDQVEDVSPELPDLYRELLLSAERTYWEESRDFLVATDPEVLRAGNFKLEPTYSGIPCVTAEALIFPILLNELAQGAMRSIAETGMHREPLIREYALHNSSDVENSIEAAQFGKSLYLAVTQRSKKTGKGERLAENLAALVQLPADKFLDEIVKAVQAYSHS